MIVEGEDGITHINVYSKGGTEIGRWLSNFAHSPIPLQEGTFQSIEGYWYWLLTRNESLKNLHGYAAKKVGKESDLVYPIHESSMPEEEFKSKIKKAIDAKLRTRIKDLSKINLPLTHYYVYGDKRVDAGHEWIIDHITDRIKQIKEYITKKENGSKKD